MLFVNLSMIIIVTTSIILHIFLNKDKFSPGFLIPVFYMLQILLALIFFGYSSFQYYGLLWILFLLWIFSIGYHTLKYKSNNSSRKINLISKTNIHFKVIKTIYKISFVLSLFYVILIFNRYSISITDLFKIETLLNINYNSAIDRYGESEGSSVLMQILLVFVYLTPLLGGIVIKYGFKHSKMVILSSFTPVFLILITQNTKATFIGAIFLFFIGLYISQLLYGNYNNSIKIKKIYKYIGFALLASFILYASMILRVGRIDNIVIENVNSRISTYYLGHIAGFDNWFSIYFEQSRAAYSFGTRTFLGIFDFLGIVNRSQGIYDSSVIFGSRSTNVFSIFRPIIEDFGLIIPFIIFYLIGFLIKLSYIQVKKSQSLKHAFIISFFLFYFSFGMFSSPWSYMSFTLVYFILALIYVFIGIFSKRSGHYETK